LRFIKCKKRRKKAEAGRDLVFSRVDVNYSRPTKIGLQNFCRKTVIILTHKCNFSVTTHKWNFEKQETSKNLQKNVVILTQNVIFRPQLEQAEKNLTHILKFIFV
jgi:hypothetical protein